MSMMTQIRDLNDHQNLDDFTDIVQSVERLKLLFILTFCEHPSIGHGVWNGCQDQLLRTIYYET